jgi:uncharacterized protein YcbX
MTDDGRGGDVVGSVAECRRYPVKSMQGLVVDRLEVGADAVAGDRARGVVTRDGVLLSAKQRRELLSAAADDDGIELPDGRRLAYGDEAVADALSEWLGAEVELAEPGDDHSVSYRMTFDPPDDTAELYDIPTPVGTFLDLAPLHLLTTATLDGVRRARPDLDWDVRRFRPNLVLDVEGEPFVEDGWSGRHLSLGDGLVLSIDQPTVRCAMPLRAQPGLEREAGLYAALVELNGEHPNHLGVYGAVVEPGPVRFGDEVRLLP